MPCGISSAPKPPCTSRPAISMAGPTARPHAERGEGEPGDAEEEHAPLAVPVAEPAADHQQDAHGQGVAGPQPLDQRLAAADVADDGRRGDVGDRRVHQVQHVGEQHDGQDQPQPGSQPGGIGSRLRLGPAARPGPGAAGGGLAASPGRALSLAMVIAVLTFVQGWPESGRGGSPALLSVLRWCGPPGAGLPGRQALARVSCPASLPAPAGVSAGSRSAARRNPTGAGPGRCRT